MCAMVRTELHDHTQKLLRKQIVNDPKAANDEYFAR